MPKISIPLDSGVPSIRPVVDEIEKAVNEIELLLSARLDKDNLWEDGNNKVALSPKSVVNMADPTRPIEGMKFFGHLSTEDGVEESLFTPLINEMDKNKLFRTVTRELAIDIKDQESMSVSRTFDIEIPVNYKLLKYKDLADYNLPEDFDDFSNNYVFDVSYMFDTDDEKPTGEHEPIADCAVTLAGVTSETITFSFYANTGEQAASAHYYTMSIFISCLCEELP